MEHPILVVGRDNWHAQPIVDELRRLECTAVWADTCAIAREMMEVVDFSLVIVDVECAEEWMICGQIAVIAQCRVAVMTPLLADDRRYRDAAFGMGVDAYVSSTDVRGRLEELLTRLGAGERRIELVDGLRRLSAHVNQPAAPRFRRGACPQVPASEPGSAS
jgi:DNA-binding response OmpR family regulator